MEAEEWSREVSQRALLGVRVVVKMQLPCVSGVLSLPQVSSGEICAVFKGAPSKGHKKLPRTLFCSLFLRPGPESTRALLLSR